MTTELMTTDNALPLAHAQADNDEQLVRLWLHGRSPRTVESYLTDIGQFESLVGKSLRAVILGDLQQFADHLEATGLEPASRRRKLAAAKSLFSFGHRLGYLTFDVARPLRLPAVRDRLSERILSEAEVQRMLALEQQPRNHGILLMLYAAGMRVSECCRLKWRDLQDRADGGQVTAFGKGGKTNVVRLPASVYGTMMELRGDAADEAPLFRSRKGGHLTPAQVWVIVRNAARRAGITKAVSCHWLRHSHASHSLERGASISLVQATLAHSSISTTGRYLHARPNDSSAMYLPV